MKFSVNDTPTFSGVRRQPIAGKSAEIKRRHIGHVVVMISMFMLLALLFVWTRVHVVELGYDISKLKKQTAELLEEKHRIEADVASLKSPERLSKIAKKKYGMRLPRGGEMIFIGK